mmetsp:Transcript_20255/g.46726  ORF Transcript_20255/g.46726 Transcript_20255/m.46726 type:complete len:425 (+) Transcript_20255:122-1396(+)
MVKLSLSLFLCLAAAPAMSTAFLSTSSRIPALRRPLSATAGVRSPARLGLSMASTETKVDWSEKLLKDSDDNNVTPYIANLVGRDLHLLPAHPLQIIKGKIEAYFQSRDSEFECKDSLDPIVTSEQCFDDLLIPEDHQSRRFSDTYYISKGKLLRTHTSAHQTELLRGGSTKFLCTGDVYRRDEIDSSHYPAFHQMEGVKILKECEGMEDREEWEQMCVDDLKSYLEGMIDEIFGPVEKRWVDAYFPFTTPSFELEIYFNDDWLEVLGCGVIQQPILDKCDMGTSHGWAFGLGLERLAMVLFDIPDIRLFWTEDTRFLKQFKEGEITKFKPYSKYPPCYKDIAFWLPEDWEENNFAELVRNVAGDLVERVELIDQFENPKKGKTSHCYRINYRSMDRSLTNEEVDALQEKVREKAAGELTVELR